MAPGLPWDAPVPAHSLCFLDLEMTGLDPARDRIVEICIERVHGEALEARLCTLVHAPAEGGQQIHGIPTAALDEAPPFEALADRVVELLAGGLVVAHGAAHDLAFLAAELQRLGHGWQPPPFIDTLAVARRALDLPSHGLATLAAHFGIDNPSPHRAANDVRVLRGLFARLVDLVQPTTLGALARVELPGRPSMTQVVALAEQAMALGRPLLVDYRRRGRPRERLALCVTAVRTDLDPPWVLGYLQHSRGRRQLRGDRILAAELASPR